MYYLLIVDWPKVVVITLPRDKVITFLMTIVCSFLCPITISCILYASMICIKRGIFINKIDVTTKTVETNLASCNIPVNSNQMSLHDETQAENQERENDSQVTNTNKNCQTGLLTFSNESSVVDFIQDQTSTPIAIEVKTYFQKLCLSNSLKLVHICSC